MNKQFQSKLSASEYKQTGSVKAKSPSNIALIKYWGKRKNQIPTNASLSYTLKNSYTETELIFAPKEPNGFVLDVFLDGKIKKDFTPKIITFFERIEAYIPFLKYFKFEVRTKNTFPHSSGIASSASGLSALSLCLLQMERQFGAVFTEEEYLRKASFLARLGSGSACRSVYKGLVEWGENAAIENSSNEYAIPYPYEVHPVFQTFRDTILLIHEGQKSVSSTVGHHLMNGHPYAERRFEAANDNLSKMVNILKEGNIQAFGELVEHEALSLHAMMMTSHPSFILMRPNTLAVLEKIWEFRKTSRQHLYFTLDAGANVHLLYLEADAVEVKTFINKELIQYCQNKKMIEDKVDFMI